jgi:hypothetical protein
MVLKKTIFFIYLIVNECPFLYPHGSIPLVTGYLPDSQGLKRLRKIQSEGGKRKTYIALLERKASLIYTYCVGSERFEIDKAGEKSIHRRGRRERRPEYIEFRKMLRTQKLLNQH